MLDEHAAWATARAIVGERLVHHARPGTEDAPALDVVAHHKGGEAAPMVRAERAVLLDAPAELGHDEHGHVGAMFLDVRVEAGEAAGEQLRALRLESLGGALDEMGVPAAEIDRRDLEADLRLDQAGDFAQSIA